MRRQEREVTDPRRIREIIRKAEILRIGFADADGVYIVPVNFGYTEEHGQRCFYFHGAREGRKFSLIRERPSVGFELDCGYRLLPAERASGYTAAYQSIIGTGTVSEVTEPQEKAFALNMLMRQCTGKLDWDFSPAELERVGVFRLDVTELSCKMH